MIQKIKLSEIKDSHDVITEQQKETFKFKGDIEPVLLEKGDELWRIVKSRGNIHSAYWLDSKGMDVIFWRHEFRQ